MAKKYNRKFVPISEDTKVIILSVLFLLALVLSMCLVEFLLFVFENWIFHI